LAWTQAGETFAQASLQGIWKRNGEIFELYTFDNVTDGKKQLVKAFWISLIRLSSLKRVSLNKLYL
tara:strand:+ start:282 stop:479 length:198 start_codon:yes stop_codon:yes gene_type:complete